MGVFSFIETFFFLSLAITFILILLLVNHFKQRLNVIENKCDTLFDITNSLLQELGNFKSYVASSILNRSNHVNSYTNNEEVIHSHTQLVNSKSNPEITIQNMENENTAKGADFFPSKGDKIVVSDNDDVTSDEDDGDSGDEHSEYGESDDDYESNDDESNKSEMDDNEDSNGDNSDTEPHINFENSANIDDLAESKIKIVNMDVQESLVVDSLKDDLESVDNLEEIVEMPEFSEDKPTIHIEKIEEIVESTNNNIEESVKESNKDIYSKMSVNELKKVVITKGLCSDASKMKKYDLLKLLEVI